MILLGNVAHNDEKIIGIKLQLPLQVNQKKHPGKVFFSGVFIPRISWEQAQLLDYVGQVGVVGDHDLSG